MSSARTFNLKSIENSADILSALNESALSKNPGCLAKLQSDQINILKPLYDEKEVLEHLDLMAEQMNQTRVFTESAVAPLFLTVQMGAAMSAPYVQSKLNFLVVADNIQTARYNGIDGGELTFKVKPTASLSSRPIIIYDDIIDLAVTAGKIIDYLVQNGADATLIYLAVMLNKDRPRDPQFNIHPDFYAMKIANQFIVGYGLDYTEGLGRDLPWIGALVKKDEEVVKIPQQQESYANSIGSRYMLHKRTLPASVPVPPSAPKNSETEFRRFHGCG